MYCLWKVKEYKIRNKDKLYNQYLDNTILSKIDDIISDKFKELNFLLENSDINTLNENLKKNSDLKLKKTLYKSITNKYNDLENQYNGLLLKLYNMKLSNKTLYNKININKIYNKINIIDKIYQEFIELLNFNNNSILNEEYEKLNKIFSQNLKDLDTLNEIINIIH